MSSPRICRRSSSDAPIRSLPLKRTVPEMRALRARVRPITVREETDLPDPDSPTMPSVWPRSTVYESPSTALTSPSSVSKWTRRSSTSSSGSAISASSRGSWCPRVVAGGAWQGRSPEGIPLGFRAGEDAARRRSAAARGCQDSREGALVAHPGVDEGVQDVHDEAHDDDEERAEEHGALDLGQIEAHDRLVGVSPDPLDVEHRFGENR